MVCHVGAEEETGAAEAEVESSVSGREEFSRWEGTHVPRAGSWRLYGAGTSQ